MNNPWAVSTEECVMCDGCCFLFAAEHTDNDGEYSCPVCAVARTERERDDARSEVARLEGIAEASQLRIEGLLAEVAALTEGSKRLAAERDEARKRSTDNQGELAEVRAQSGEGWQVTHCLADRMRITREAADHWKAMLQERAKERDEAQARLKTATLNVIRYAGERDDARRERDEALREVAEADAAAEKLALKVDGIEAQAAVMREALELALYVVDAHPPSHFTMARERGRAALASDAGSALLAELAALREAWDLYAEHQSLCDVYISSHADCTCEYSAMAARIKALKAGTS